MRPVSWWWALNPLVPILDPLPTVVVTNTFQRLRTLTFALAISIRFWGAISLDLDAAEKALTGLTSDSEPTVADVARSMIQIANANIVRAIRGLASRSPIPLDDTILFAFGGAGGLHACEIAEELNVPKVYFPNEPGVFSAEGIADAPYILWESVSVHETLSTYSAGADAISTLQARALKNADEHYQAFSTSATDLTLIADCHYRGQSHTLAVEIPSAQWASPELAGWLTSAFIERHQELYGYVLENGAEVLLASLRLKLVYQPWRDSREDGRKAASLTTEGPAVLTSYGATLRLPAGWQATALSDGGYLCSKIATKQERALLHHLRRIDLSLSRLPKRWGRRWNTPHSRRTLRSAVITPVPSFRPPETF